MTGLSVTPITAKLAARYVTAHHYLHRRPPISHAYGLVAGSDLVGVCTYGTPASRHLQMSACPSEPSLVLELNRLWVHDDQPRNTESWFVSRTLRLLPPRIVVSYADPAHGHLGYIYRALNFRYAGWTDMDRVTPRFDYIPTVADEPDGLFPGESRPAHTRDAFRGGYSEKRRRVAKVKYWTVTGNRTERRRLIGLCGWPSLDWVSDPPPIPDNGNGPRLG